MRKLVLAAVSIAILCSATSAFARSIRDELRQDVETRSGGMCTLSGIAVEKSDMRTPCQHFPKTTEQQPAPQQQPAPVNPGTSQQPSSK